MIRRAFGPGEVDRLPAVTAPVCRKPAHHRSPVLRRAYRAKWQLQSSVWVCVADLHLMILPAREAMATHDPYSQVDADGVDRAYVRVSRDVWRALQTRRRPEEIAHLREALANIYTLEGAASALALAGAA